MTGFRRAGHADAEQGNLGGESLGDLAGELDFLQCFKTGVSAIEMNRKYDEVEARLAEWRERLEALKADIEAMKRQ